MTLWAVFSETPESRLERGVIKFMWKMCVKLPAMEGRYGTDFLAEQNVKICWHAEATNRFSRPVIAIKIIENRNEILTLSKRIQSFDTQFRLMLSCCRCLNSQLCNFSYFYFVHSIFSPRDVIPQLTQLSNGKTLPWYRKQNQNCCSVQLWCG